MAQIVNNPQQAGGHRITSAKIFQTFLKVIPGGALPRCGAKEKASERILLPVENHVFDIFAHSTSKPEIMVSGEQALKEIQKTGVLNQLYAYRLKLAQRAGNRAVLCGTQGMVTL